MTFVLIQRDEVITPQPGVYCSFPQLIYDAQGVALVYRQGVFNPDDDRPGMKAHGLDGTVMACRWSPNQQAWNPPEVAVRSDEYAPGWLDAVFTSLDHNGHHGPLAGLLRRYPSSRPLFITYGSCMSSLSHPMPSYVGGRYWDGYQSYAEWGPIIPLKSTEWLQSFYVQTRLADAWDHDLAYEGYKPNRICWPILAVSTDQGRSWKERSIIGGRHFVSWIQDEEKRTKPIWGNETAVLFHHEQLIAVMRTADAWPGPLYMAISKDHGYTWSDPRPTGLYGEAPVWAVMPSGQVILGFRGFLRDASGKVQRHGGTFSLALYDAPYQEFGPEWVVDMYHGNHYDGGYGSLLVAAEAGVGESDRLWVTYYASQDDTTRYPGIRCAWVDVLPGVV